MFNYLFDGTPFAYLHSLLSETLINCFKSCTASRPAAQPHPHCSERNAPPPPTPGSSPCSTQAQAKTDLANPSWNLDTCSLRGEMEKKKKTQLKNKEEKKAPGDSVTQPAFWTTVSHLQMIKSKLRELQKLPMSHGQLQRTPECMDLWALREPELLKGENHKASSLLVVPFYFPLFLTSISVRKIRYLNSALCSSSFRQKYWFCTLNTLFALGTENVCPRLRNRAGSFSCALSSTFLISGVLYASQLTCFFGGMTAQIPPGKNKGTPMGWNSKYRLQCEHLVWQGKQAMTRKRLQGRSVGSESAG